MHHRMKGLGIELVIVHGYIRIDRSRHLYTNETAVAREIYEIQEGKSRVWFTILHKMQDKIAFLYRTKLFISGRIFYS